MFFHQWTTKQKTSYAWSNQFQQKTKLLGFKSVQFYWQTHEHKLVYLGLDNPQGTSIQCVRIGFQMIQGSKILIVLTYQNLSSTDQIAYMQNLKFSRSVHQNIRISDLTKHLKKTQGMFFKTQKYKRFLSVAISTGDHSHTL